MEMKLLIIDIHALISQIRTAFKRKKAREMALREESYGTNCQLEESRV
jgi:hypothetical protein